ncbi:hypothetical protein ACFO9E_34965 [Streptomyces maoxianensis]|uniref:Uncharacterized protein n=1 Tax=Streptomyces maoxianensis TaxID=1459942 RepID=A0ABV9GG13_9ACTN
MVEMDEQTRAELIERQECSRCAAPGQLGVPDEGGNGRYLVPGVPVKLLD